MYHSPFDPFVVFIETQSATPQKDWLTFFSDVIGALAWPLVIFFIALLFKKQLFQLFQRIRNLDYSNGKWTMSFTETMDKLKNLTSEEELNTAKESKKEIKSITFDEIIEQYPETAIFLSWRELESTIRNKVLEMDLSPQQGRHNINLYQSIEKLSRITSIGSDSVVIFKDLLGLRNSVFHNQDIDVSARDARKFVDFAMLLNSRITNATRIIG